MAVTCLFCKFLKRGLVGKLNAKQVEFTLAKGEHIWE